jgi:hypothetical protein
MTHTAPPQARSRDARGNCVRIQALLQTLLLTLLAALLGRPRRAAAAWHAIAGTCGPAWDSEPDVLEWHSTDADDEYARACNTLLRHYHADCDPSILYVIGPRPNRGLNPRPRENPIPRPRTARAPPESPRAISDRMESSGRKICVLNQNARAVADRPSGRLPLQ